MKVSLVKLREYGKPTWPSKAISRMLPFYKSNQGMYVHRVRSGYQHWRDSTYHHTSVRFWCGNSGILEGKGKLFSTIPEGEVLCATCEGRAIGAGMDGARVINGKEVRYSPKQKPRSNDKQG